MKILSRFWMYLEGLKFLAQAAGDYLDKGRGDFREFLASRALHRGLRAALERAKGVPGEALLSLGCFLVPAPLSATFGARTGDGEGGEAVAVEHLGDMPRHVNPEALLEILSYWVPAGTYLIAASDNWDETQGVRFGGPGVFTLLPVSPDGLIRDGETPVARIGEYGEVESLAPLRLPPSEPPLE